MPSQIPLATRTGLSNQDNPLSVFCAHDLNDTHHDEVVSFLANSPLGGLFLRGHVDDNGLVSSSNRGRFVGVRSRRGVLEGIGLIGHATLFEARSEAAIAAIASTAQQSRTTHMLLGEQAKLETFWNYYSRDGQESHAFCRELLFEKNAPAKDLQPDSSLRLANPSDIDLLLPVHARMAFEESGTNPLQKDPAGFQERYLRRIERDRVWIVTDNERLVFKAEVALQTQDVVYLEGIHVNPEMRGAGLGGKLLSGLGNILLERARSICLLVNERNLAAQALDRKAGFNFRGYYKTIFLQPGNAN